MTPTTPPTNPYVGPRTFSYEQRDLFFGREREARDLLARVLSERLLLFYAQSGAGKSSLLHTRLIPQLEEEKGFAVLPVARVSGELPAGVDRVDNIFAYNLMLSVVEDCDPALLAGVTMSDFLARLALRTVVDDDGRERETWLYDAAQTPAVGGVQRYTLIIDQFEEIITAHPGRWHEREAFFRQLDSAMQADPNLWVVLTLREDYVAALDPYAPLLADRLRARFLMEHMKTEAALDAIRKPAELAGRPFAPGVAEKLVNDLRQIRVAGQENTVAGEYVEPVQLEVVCYQLWENLGRGAGGPRETEGTQITLADLAEAGDVDRALTQFYEETLAVVLADPAAAGVSERQLRTWFDQELITGAGTRGLVHQGDADTGGLPNGLVNALQRSFLVRAETRGGNAWIELVHDRFVEPIRVNNAAWFPLHLSALQRQAALWSEQGRSSGLLLRGTALTEAETWAAANPGGLEPYEQDFLSECQAAQATIERDRRQSRRIRVLAVVAAIVAILAMVAAAIALDRTHTADLAKQQAVDAKATAEMSAAEADRQRLAAEDQRVLADQEKQRAETSASEAQRQARIASLQRLGVQTRLNLDPNYDLALLLSLAVDGSEIDTVEAGGNLAETLEYSPQAQYFLRGHDAPVISVALDASGRRLASGDENGKLVLWDLTTDPPAPRTLVGPDQPIHALSFVPEQDALVSLGYTSYGDGSTEAFVWNAETGDKIWQLSIPLGDLVERAALSPDGSRIALLTNRTTITLWDVLKDAQIGEPMTVAEPSMYSWVEGLAFSPDAEKLALYLGDEEEKGIILWDIAGQQTIGQPRTEHSNSVSVLKFSPDGRLLVSSSGDGTTYLWDVDGWNLLYQFPETRRWLGMDEVGLGLAFSPDSQTLVIGDHKGTVTFWDVANPQPIFRSLGGRESEVLSLAFSQDGQRLAAGGQDGAIILYGLNNTSRIGETLVDYQPSSMRWALSPDGKTIAASSLSGEISLVDSISGKPTGQPLAGHSDAIYGLAFHPSKPLLASTATDYATVQVVPWDLQRRAPSLESLRQPGYVGLDLQYSYDGSYLSYREDEDGSVHLYAADSLTSTGWLKPPIEDSYSAIAFGSKSDVLAAGTVGGQVELWDVDTLRPIWQSKEKAWDGVTSLAFSPDQLVLAMGESGGRILLLDVRTGKVLRVLGDSDNQMGVQQLEFAPDGEMLASGGADNTIVLWDIASGRRVTLLQTPYINGVEKLAFAPEGGVLFSSGDGLLTRWELDDAAWRALACRIASRNLSVEEWKRYISPEAPYRLSCPELPPHSSVLQSAIKSSAELARAGQIDQALTQIEQALQLAGGTDRDLRAEAQPLLAASLVEQAGSLAKQGDLQEATAIYEMAQYLDPSLNLNPMKQAKQLYDDSLARILNSRVSAMVSTGDIDGAISVIEQTLAENPSIDVQDVTWNNLCWSGSLYGRADTVLQACDRAVTLAPEEGDIRDSRGLARALTGDTAGAIADFEFAVRWAESTFFDPDFVDLRRAWIAALKAGQNPFDEATLQALRSQ